MATLPSRFVIVVGTYDGVVGGWEKQEDGVFELTFATAVHQGSVRSLAMAATSPQDGNPGTLLSCGYDEMLKTHDWKKRLNSSGEIRTPSDFGTPVCSSFVPPTTAPSTHCIVGFSGGKVAIYKKRDWSLQHVLAGHDGGLASLGVHPSGKLALTGGQTDGKLKLWDLTKGRLAYVTKLAPSSSRGARSFFDPILSIVWTREGNAYAWAYGNHITVRDGATGKDLLDVETPSKVNQVALLEGEDGVFVAAACNDGSLPVLAVADVDADETTRRALLAVEPVDSVVAGEERYKCIESIHHGYHVITATSAGVVSLMNLQGAINMIMSEGDQTAVNKAGEGQEEEEEDDNDFELAVDIVASVRLGSGARITCLSAWCSDLPLKVEGSKEIDGQKEDEPVETLDAGEAKRSGTKRKENIFKEIGMDASALEKARALVHQAKKIEKKKAKKRKNNGLQNSY
jgi:protein MAK11